MNVDPKRDIWGALINEKASSLKSGVNEEKHFLFVGSEKSGKSCLQNQFFSRRDEPPETLALSYQSASVRQDDKEVVLHFWEIGSGTKLDQLINTIVTKETLKDFNAFICFNVNKPSSILTAIDWAENLISKFAYKSQSIYFIGTFYDTFESNDPSQKINTVQGLRAIASKYHAGLIFTSYKDDNLANRFKGLIRQLALGETPTGEIITQHISPVFILPDSDKECGGNEIISPYVRQLKSAPPDDDAQAASKDDPTSSKFAEKEIDELAETKERELEEKLRTLRANII
ncbi:hypothetical protein TVAG_277480 [Trichomonas vaginalis G3]|uniref:Cytoplasmic dynein 2 light intermediate chain 1 n=1 Tax=Trichomonas vaginalis (strain ATCC PRA-98 / G3) TaxID=412133 RepID=A2FTV7_TRIV3|nr:intraciliary retrograde transport [Trichomonas vaginalis G3]EAX91678.1 hypothetical protein TVAG_277480 [Trichomonas vaginalis G3]KAI5487256.1 intraciliary retrograde transport [Trichomonas vaginalis G3]|eukprot:XP_001304608.1 hypothetical protein [Trichomonas vaginalis G3]